MEIIKRHAVILGLSLLVGLGLNVQQAHTDNPFTTPCKSEGQNGCYWDAHKQGNHKGKSYVVTKSGQVFRFAPDVSTDPKHPFRK